MCLYASVIHRLCYLTTSLQAKDEVRFIFVRHVDQVLLHALAPLATTAATEEDTSPPSLRMRQHSIDVSGQGEDEAMTAGGDGSWTLVRGASRSSCHWCSAVMCACGAA